MGPNGSTNSVVGVSGNRSGNGIGGVGDFSGDVSCDVGAISFIVYIGEMGATWIHLVGNCCCVDEWSVTSCEGECATILCTSENVGMSALLSVGSVMGGGN